MEPTIKIHTGNCLDVLKEYPDNYFDSIVTDPPYGLGKEPNPNLVIADWIKQGYHEITGKGFMGKEWDCFVPQPIIFKEILRVLKPGGHMLCACGTRTQDWMTMSLRFAGFEVRDVITWHYGSGFPKSLDISKALDKYFGEDDSEAIDRYKGWGTALKPATEFFTLARKPLSEPTVSQNILKWGVGGINIDGCRIRVSEQDIETSILKQSKNPTNNYNNNPLKKYGDYEKNEAVAIKENGRFPANVMFDEDMANELDQQSGITTSGKVKEDKNSYEGISNTKFLRGISNSQNQHGDTGGASRFFYMAKASRSERNKGLENLGLKKEFGHSRFDKCKNCGGYLLQGPDRDSGCTCDNPERENLTVHGNFHPTVKPVSLMTELVKLITPPGGVCLDPFCGSGTTGVGCKINNFNAVLIDMDADYTKITQHRVNAWVPEKEVKEQLKKTETIIKEQNTLQFPE